jgi:hypothetical protein
LSRVAKTDSDIVTRAARSQTRARALSIIHCIDVASVVLSLSMLENLVRTSTLLRTVLLLARCSEPLKFRGLAEPEITGLSPVMTITQQRLATRLI